MQEHATGSPRLRAAAAVVMVVAVIAVFAWLTHSSVAGAASATPGGSTPAATQPYSSSTPAADHPCPKDEQGSGNSSGQPAAPSQSQPSTGTSSDL